MSHRDGLGRFVTDADWELLRWETEVYEPAVEAELDAEHAELVASERWMPYESEFHRSWALEDSLDGDWL